MKYKRPEYDSIKQRHQNGECKDYQVHYEANGTPNWTLYVQTTSTNTRVKIVQVVSVKRQIWIFATFYREEKINRHVLCLPESLLFANTLMKAKTVLKNEDHEEALHQRKCLDGQLDCSPKWFLPSVVDC